VNEGEIGIGMHGGESLSHLGDQLRQPLRSAVRFRSFQRNLIARRRAVGTEQTVAVNWAFIGIGAVGAELARLVIGSLLLFEVAVGLPWDVVEAVLTGCLVGLREVGWDGDKSVVRLGFLATAALLYTVYAAGIMSGLLGDPSQHRAFEQLLGCPWGDAIAS
jgi:hypothetical protein